MGGDVAAGTGSGNTAGGGAGGTGGTSSGDGGSAGQLGNCDECNDDDPCTDDVCTANGCEHPNNTAACEDGNPCTAGDICKDGMCTAGEQPACDDGSECTVDHCDPESGCEHTPVDASGEDDDNQEIPDNFTECGDAPDEDVQSIVTLSGEGSVGSISVSVDLRHEWVGDLVIELSHAGVSVLILDQPEDGLGENAGELDGVYTFQDGAPNLPNRERRGSMIPPSTYRPLEPFSAFAGTPIAGSWTLRVADYCGGDEGDFSGFALSVNPACAGENSCDGACSAGACECN